MSTGPGAFRANAPAIDVEAMQRDLSRIPAVTSARVVLEGDELREVHVVCGSSRSPKLVGRDVQSLLAARWGVDIDHRKVSVVQLEGAEDASSPEGDPEVVTAPTTPPPAPRAGPGKVVIDNLSVSLTRTGAEATVVVTMGDQQSAGTARGVPSWAGQLRLAATATLAALAHGDSRLASFAVADVASVRMGSEAVIVTTLTGWADGVESNLAGAAPIGSAGELRAAAESVLRALPLRP